MSLLKLANQNPNVDQLVKQYRIETLHKFISGQPMKSIQQSYDNYLKVIANNPDYITKENMKGEIKRGIGAGAIAGAITGGMYKKNLKGALAGSALTALIGAGYGYLKAKQSGRRVSRQARIALNSPATQRYQGLKYILATAKAKYGINRPIE